jgi:hypothetical protein
MAITVHPRIQLRGAPEEREASPGTLIRVLVYAPSETRFAWVESEISHADVMIQIAHSVDQAVSALVEDPPPRPQILIADFDDMAPGELMHLHVLREQGWFGQIVALGDLPPTLCSSLGIERVLPPPFARNALRDLIALSGFVATTTRLPVL